jgi:hypothetical protein
VAAQNESDAATTSVDVRAPSRDPRMTTTCPVCGGTKPRFFMRCDDCLGVHVQPGALIDAITPYASDVAAQLFVAHFGDGATLEDIGDALGVTRERVRQIEQVALRHLRARAKLAGISREDIAAILVGRVGANEHVESTHYEPTRQRFNEIRRAPAVIVDESPSPFTAALTDAVDEVIAVGELIARAADYAERESR